MHRIHTHALAIAVLLGALAHPAWVGAQISGATGSTSGSSCSGDDADGFCGFGRTTQINDGTTFKSRYAWNTNADIGIFSTRDVSGSAQHNMSFNATAPGDYTLGVAQSFVGDMNRISDASGCDGSANVSGVTGSRTGSGTLAGSLSVADPGSIDNGGGDSNLPFNSSASATVTAFSNGATQAHTLTFTWNSQARSNSCEAAVRLGEQNGSTIGCSACEYPGSPGRTQSTDGHFVTVTFTSLCGNGVVDSGAGEQCDVGIGNSPCCASNCRFASSATVCRTAAGECDLQETCTGSAATCPADAKKASGTACTADSSPCTLDRCDGTNVFCTHPAGNAGTICRPSGGTCDVAETCNGVSTSCPADAKQPNGTVCRAAASACDAAETCDGVNSLCPGDAPLPNGTVCRAASGDCDIAETCNGVAFTCPADAVQPSGTGCTPDSNPCSLDQCNGSSKVCQHPAGNAGAVCRTSAGVCDPQETCTGASTTCPGDVLDPSGTVCRPSFGACDPQETCTGSSPTCPADARSPSGTVCRAATDVCDAVETCDGTNATCPVDGLAAPGTVCRTATDECDPQEVCSGGSAACPVDAVSPNGTPCSSDANPCTVDACDGTSPACQHPAGNAGTLCRPSAGDCDPQETCDGANTACPVDSVSGAFVVCRPSAGGCDLAENCDGTTVACPADAKQPSGAVCRASAGDCDPAETCDGAGDACPADSVSGAFVVCRPAGGVCDLAENCDGTNVACPADAKSTATCRTSGGACDPAEVCDGVTNDCPADAKSTGVCRPAADSCDAVESCNGVANACPADADLPDGSSCSDGDSCTSGETCDAGVCQGGSPDPDGCADGFLCYKSKAAATPRVTVSLADAYDGARDFDVLKARHVCTPSEVNGDTVLDDGVHLRSYRIKQTVALPKHVPQTNVEVTNVIGTIRLDTIKADLLMIPANKDLGTPPSAPLNGTHGVDHFKCYKVKVTPGTNRFPKGVQVDVSDQFIAPAPDKVFDLKKPRHLCTPVDQGGQGIKNEDGYLLCYLAKPAKGQVKHLRRFPVYTADELNSAVVSTIKEEELCVPSTVTP